MTRHSDETLMAFADGELDRRERERLSRALASDDQARRSVYILRLSRLCVEWLFDDALKLAPPPIGAAAGASAAPAKRCHWNVSQTAATVLLYGAPGVAIGALGGFLLHFAIVSHNYGPGASTLLGPIPKESVISDALSFSGTGGGTWLTRDGGRIVMSQKFRDQYGNRCREVEVFTTRPDGVPNEVIIACRVRNGGWAAVAAVATRSKGRRTDALYSTSGAEVRSAVDGVLAMIGATPSSATTNRESSTQ
ncbi:MAG: hypothetical protein NW216_03770 [Hyphomicrobium sp.]|nr:hypothetical protein [Hyphomicrobium sp.]